MAIKKQTGIEWIIGSPYSYTISVGISVTLISLVLGAWYIVVQMDPDPYARGALLFRFSRPDLVFAFFVDNWKSLMNDTRVSIEHVFISLAIGSIIGYPFGVWLATLRKVKFVARDILGIVLSYPKLGVILLLVAWFGHQQSLIYVFNTYVVLLLSIMLSFRSANSILNGEGSTSKDVEYSLVLRFRNRRNLIRRYLLRALRRDWISSIMFCSVILWPLLIFTESMVDSSKAGLGSLAYSAGSEDLRLEAFYASSGLIALCNLITWLSLALIERSFAR